MKRPRLWYLYTLNGHIISFGVGFAYYTVTAVQSLNRIMSKSSHALFLYNGLLLGIEKHKS